MPRRRDYSYLMKVKSFFRRNDQAGIVLCAALLTTLTGCVGYVDRPSQGSVYVEPQTTFLVQDDYVYYPSYGVYYSNSRRQYAYRENNVWVSRPAPRGVSVEVLRASPSVRMDFHDSPAQHHEAVVRQYPKNWSPPAGNQDRRPNPGDGPHGENH
jgi:hypothetical protein